MNGRRRNVPLVSKEQNRVSSARSHLIRSLYRFATTEHSRSVAAISLVCATFMPCVNTPLAWKQPFTPVRMRISSNHTGTLVQSVRNIYQSSFCRCVADHQRDAQYPFLDEQVVAHLQQLPMTLKARVLYIAIIYVMLVYQACCCKTCDACVYLIVEMDMN